MIKKFLSLSFITQAVLVGIISGVATSLILIREGLFVITALFTPIFGAIFGLVTVPFFIHYSNLVKKSRKIWSVIFWVVVSALSGWLAVWVAVLSGKIIGGETDMVFLSYALAGAIGTITLSFPFRYIFNIKSLRLWRFLVAGSGIPVVVLLALFVLQGDANIMAGNYWGINLGPVFNIPLFILWQTAMVVLFSLELKKQNNVPIPSNYISI